MPRATPRDDPGFDWNLMPSLILGALLNPINSSILAVSLVPIGNAFHAPSSQTAWLVSALYLATAIGQPVVGKLVDTYGPRTLLLAGASLTGIAGVIGTLAPNLPVLVVARVILGFGTCAGYPAAMYLIKSESLRTGTDSPQSVLTVLAVSSQTIVVLGPPLGGLLIGVGGWRLTLAVNIPLALATIAMGARTLPKGEQMALGAQRKVPPKLDLLGIALFAGMLASLLLFLMSPSLPTLPLVGATLALGALLALRELRVSEPFLDLRVFGGNAPLLRTYLRTVLAQTVSYAFLYGFTQWLQDGRGLSAAQAGLMLLPLSIVAIAISSVTGRSKALRRKLVVGSFAQTVGVGLLLVLGPSSPIWLIVLVIGVVGIPQGLLSLANQNAVYYQAEPSLMGASAGLLRTFAYLGAIIAAAATGGFFGDRASTGGMHHLAMLLVGLAALLLVLTVIDRRLGRIAEAVAEDEPAGVSA